MRFDALEKPLAIHPCPRISNDLDVFWKKLIAILFFYESTVLRSFLPSMTYKTK